MRRRAAEKKVILPDPKYKDDVVSKFVNRLMRSGKKSLAQNILYTAFDILADKTKNMQIEGVDDGDSREGGSGGRSALNVFKKILETVGPIVEVKSRRVGGATYQIPIEVEPERRTALAMRWLVEAARKRSEKGMANRLAAEFADVLSGRGEAMKKKEETYRMARANQAFAHYRWN
jgi:small subunit ribosomal protein S7